MLCVSVSNAETVDGPANIRSKPNGKVIATIGDGEKLNVLSYKNGWYEVEIPVYVYKKSAPDGLSSVVPNTSLYNNNGRIIGKTLDNANIVDGPGEEEDRYQGAIIGYTATTNIRPESVLESEIEKLLAKHKFSLNTDWWSHINKSRYESWKIYGDFESFNVGEELALDPSPTARIILYFYKKNLFAIYHVKPINFQSFKGSVKVLSGKIDYLEMLTGSVKDDFKREFFEPLATSD